MNVYVYPLICLSPYFIRYFIAERARGFCPIRLIKLGITQCVTTGTECYLYNYNKSGTKSQQFNGRLDNLYYHLSI
jgi:hypothetical protein